MNCIIVDDEEFDRLSIRETLELHLPHISILAECENVPEAVKAIYKLKPQLVFLDIEMPHQNGFALFDYFDTNETEFKIVFVTSYSEYTLQAFQMSTIDYLLKPVELKCIQRAIEKAEIYFSNKESIAILKENLHKPNDKKLVLKSAGDIYIVKLADIICIQAEGNYSKFMTTSHNVLTITKKLAEFEYLTQTETFFRSHRSFIINLSHIKKVDKKNFTLVMLNNEEAFLAQDKMQALLEKIESN